MIQPVDNNNQPGKKADKRTDKLDVDGKKEASRTATKDPKPEWWTKNPSPVKDWLIPTGKRFHDFFNSLDLKANMSDWPKFPYHKPGNNSKPKGLCLKYQALGECNLGCFNAHVDPTTFAEAARKTMDERFKLIHT